MHVLLGLGYLTRIIILVFHSFPCENMMSLFLIAIVFYIFFIHSSVEGHLGCFQFLAIMNKAAMNIVEQVSLWDVPASFGYMARSGNAGS